MKILFLSHRIPYPPNKGDKIRSYHLLKFLSQKYKIYLATILDEKKDVQYHKSLEKYCEEIKFVYFNKKINLFKNLFSRKPFSITSFYNTKLQDYVNQIVAEQNLDAIICFCSSMAEYVFRCNLIKQNKIHPLKLIMDYVDLDSDKWLQYANYKKIPLNMIYRIENKRLLEYEKKINKIFDYSIFVSDREEKVFKKYYPEARNIFVIQNGVNAEYFIPKDNSKLRSFKKEIDPILVFTGVMNYFANEDGVCWFSNKIYPMILNRFPNAQFYIVGNNPTNKIIKLRKIKGIIVTGYVSDIRKYYHMADICVIPLRIARGLQNKVLEAMACGNAVVATSNASDGIKCQNNKDIVIANDEENFAKEVIRLLENVEIRQKLGANAIENVKKNYNWRENIEGFTQLLEG